MKEKIKSLLSELEKSKIINYAEILDSYNLISSSIKKNYATFLTEKKLEEELLKTAESFLENYNPEQYIDLAGDARLMWGEKSEFEIKLRSLLVERIRQSNNNFQREIIINFFEEINNNTYRYYLDSEGLGEGIFGYNLISKIIECDLADRVKSLNNCGLYYFNGLLRREYLEISNAGEVRNKDIPHLEKIKDLLKKQFGEEKGRLRKVRIEETIDKIDNAIEHINATKR